MDVVNKVWQISLDRTSKVAMSVSMFLFTPKIYWRYIIMYCSVQHIPDDCSNTQDFIWCGNISLSNFFET